MFLLGLSTVAENSVGSFESWMIFLISKLSTLDAKEINLQGWGGFSETNFRDCIPGDRIWEDWKYKPVLGSETEQVGFC